MALVRDLPAPVAEFELVEAVAAALAGACGCFEAASHLDDASLAVTFVRAADRQP